MNHLTAKFHHRLLCGHHFYSHWFSARLADQQGQGIIEYVMLVSLIAITLIGSLISVKEIIYNVITTIPYLS